MGLFSSLFGDRPSIPDGAWLNDYRDDSWRKIDGFDSGRVVEICVDSCVTRAPGTFFIFRSYDVKQRNYAYIAAIVAAGKSEILILVDRVESPSGAVLKNDDFTRKRSLGSMYSRLANPAKNFGAFNDFQFDPPYLALVLAGAGFSR